MATLDSLLNVYALPTGRRLVALKSVRDAAQSCGNTALVGWVDDALKHDAQTRGVELDWLRQKQTPAAKPSDAVQVDQELDRTLAGVHGVLSGVVNGALPGQPVEDAAVLLPLLFPAGLGALTQGSHVDQCTAVEAVMREVRKPEHAARITALRLGPALDRVDALTKKLSDILSAAAKAPGVAHSSVVAAQQKGLSNLRVTVAKVIGMHPLDTPEDTLARATLLEGVTRQGAAFAEAFKRRRGGTDVNPETGEPADEVAG